MKIGTHVCLVGTDGYMPPIGACGVIVEPLDDDGDYGVEFPDYPCPHPPGKHWYAYQAWLVPLDTYKSTSEDKQHLPLEPIAC